MAEVEVVVFDELVDVKAAVELDEEVVDVEVAGAVEPVGVGEPVEVDELVDTAVAN